MSTFSAKAADIKPVWYLIDAENKTLGRLATAVAERLRGKHKPEFTPHMDTGDYIVVINAEKIHTTGKKLTDKLYHRYTGYQSGLKTVNLEKLLATHPERVIEFAVKGMLPKGPLGRATLKKLKIYAGSEHPHTAQQLTKLEIEA
jgi:large subunit ribosomal protein L13